MITDNNPYDRRLERTLSRYVKINKKPTDVQINNENGHASRSKRQALADVSSNARSNAKVVRLLKTDGPVALASAEVELFADQVESDEPDGENEIYIPRSDAVNGRTNDKRNLTIDLFDSLDVPDHPIQKDPSLVRSCATYKLDRSSHTIWRWMGLKFTEKYIHSERNCEPWPIITYAIMTIEILVMISITSYHGITSFGFSEQGVSKIILHQTNSYQSATYYEHPNIWIGPTFAALISEGAKFTPCMRRELSIEKAIKKRRILENDTGCCVRNDLTGCVQTHQSQCSKRTSIWIRYPDRPGPVCGQDPEYCLDRKDGFQSTDITDWPICRHNDKQLVAKSSDIHMKCMVRARPCCIGIYGKCALVSQEYCEFIKGTYHPEATLCSQVSCMEDVCRSLLYPYQLHRLFLSLFMHAGFIQLGLILWLQYLYMRPLEQLFGYSRVLTLFLVSGVGGNLASAVFLPLLPDVGPSASLFGMISFLLFELVRNRKEYQYQNPWKSYLKFMVFLVVLLLPGLFLPFVDFYSMLFGLIYGSLTLVLIHPKIQSKPLIYGAIFTLIALTIGFFSILFIQPEFMSDITTYANKVNCIPIPAIHLNCSNLDIAYKEIKALN